MASQGHGRRREHPHEHRQAGLRPTASLPARARVFVIALCLAVIGFLVWLTIDLLMTDSLPVAIVLMILSYIGFAVLLVALVTVTRAAFSLRSLPFLLGRSIYRLLTRN